MQPAPLAESACPVAVLSGRHGLCIQYKQCKVLEPKFIHEQLYSLRRVIFDAIEAFLVPCSVQESLLARLISVCKQHLAFPGCSRDLAARLLGRLLSRPDSESHLLDFVAWASGSLKDDNGRQALFKIPGQ